ncbi:MAG: M6 family metalloprotease domain-containing protein, partial [Acidobacteria bacterium]|nr:M6 family metalloprotease domain-containing protein [Acidobacteriota bacterium]
MTLIMASMVLSQSLLFSLEPPAKGELKRLAAEGKLEEAKSFARELGNHKASPQLVARFQYKYQRLLLEKKGLSPVEIDEILAPPPAWQGMPTTGNVKILTVLIDFSDTPHIAADTHAVVDSRIFGDGSGGAPYDSLRNFYRRSSYNLLEIGGNVLGWYTTAYPRSSVTQTTSGRQALIKEALNYYNGLGHDFSQYDNDGDGAIDYLAVVWAGAHGAWASFWWGYQTSFSDGSYLLDGKRLSSYSWQWESYTYPSGSFSPSVLIHETGHALGLPDYYDYDDTVGPDGGVGGLDQMDSTGDHNAFSKWMLEWLTPTAVSSGTQTVTMAPSATSPQAAIFMPTASASESFAEFFMVQNRYRTGNDTPFPTDGLVIWHVDARLSGGDFIYDNSYTAHKLLRLMEADGLEEIETNNANADAGDYYPQGGQFGPATMPSSSAYSGLPTAMGVRSITAPGLSQSCEIYRFVDDTPPTGAPTAPVDEGATIGRTRLVFTWTQGSAADLESGIAGYNLRVGTSPGGNNLFQGSVGNVLTYAVSGAVNGSTYYASVQAVNGLGTGGSWSSSSDGIRVELPSLAVALDTTGLDWATSGNAAWFGQTGTYHDGVDAAQSPTLGNSQSATFQSTMTGPGALTFYWKVSSELGYDYLTFYLDGVEQFKISGEVNWAQRSVTIPAGSHVARWTYAKDTYVAEG